MNKLKIEYTDNVPELELKCAMIKPSSLSRSEQISRDERKEKKKFERIRKEYEDR